MVRGSPVNDTTGLVDGRQGGSNNRKWIIVFLSLLSLALLASTIALAVVNAQSSSSSNSSNSSEPVNDVCMTPYCIRAADYILRSIDQTVDPCEDFYQFSCGNWIKQARIPEDSGVENIFSLIDGQLTGNLIDVLSIPSDQESSETNSTRNARILFNSCMNETQIELDGIDPIIFLIHQEFGSWPLIEGPSWNSSNFNLTQLLLKMRKYNDGFPYSITTSTNQENSSIYDIELGQGTLGLENREYYENHSDITTAYRQFMTDFASLLTNDSHTIVNDVVSIYLLEKQISEMYWDDDEQRTRENETIKTEVGKLAQDLKSDFDFTNFIRQIYSSAGVQLNDQDLVTVSEVEFLLNVSKLLSTYDPRTVQNYFVWRFMMNLAPNMPRAVRETREQFDRVFKGISSSPPRSTVCANYVNDNMGFAVSRLYLKYYFDETARTQSREIIANVRSAFMDMLNAADWMDQDSKVKAVEKAKVIFENIGYPDYVVNPDPTQLDQMYSDYYFDPSPYIGNAVHLQAAQVQSDLAKLHTLVNHRAWGDLAPTVVNAFYEPSTNSISFPAGILQTPYFNKDAPKYLNYGGIGMVIGHEITHGFDDTGRQYDENGNRVSWWSNATVENFNTRKQCIIEQYSNYTVEQIHKNLNGQQTQGENIADNGGIKSSFYAYRNWTANNPKVDLLLPGLGNYTKEQMFFMGFAHGWCAKMTDAYTLNKVLTDVHSIPRFRVLGPVSNFVEFDNVFNCKPGQGSSRKDKCAVW